jgi:hypothetical protein
LRLEQTKQPRILCGAFVLFAFGALNKAFGDEIGGIVAEANNLVLIISATAIVAAITTAIPFWFILAWTLGLGWFLYWRRCCFCCRCGLWLWSW